MKSFRILTSTAAVLGLALLPATAFAQNAPTATANLQTADGKPAGTATFTQYPNGVLIAVELSGLSPGERGIHIHQTGQCSPDFSAAGDHFAPEGNDHGIAHEGGMHAGDLPNIFVSGDGTAKAHYFNDRITLEEGEASLFDDDGSALIVHAQADTYGQEAGAGGRDACGVIEQGN